MQIQREGKLSSNQSNETLVLQGKFKFNKLNYLIFNDYSDSKECCLLCSNLELLENNCLLLSWDFVNCRLQIKAAVKTPSDLMRIPHFTFSRKDLFNGKNSERPIEFNPISAFGLVTKKSILFSGSEKYLFVVFLQVKKQHKIVFKCTNDAKSIQKLNFLFHAIQPECSYVFSGLEKKKIKLSQHQSEYSSLLSFDMAKSQIYMENESLNTNYFFFPESKESQENGNISARISGLEQLTQHLKASQSERNHTCANEGGMSDENYAQTISYEGTISNIFDADIGLFELDDEIKLHMGLFRFSHLLPFMQVGCSVKLFNVHVIVNSSNQVEFLVPCSISTVNLARFAPVEDKAGIGKGAFSAAESSKKRESFMQQFKNFNITDIIFYYKLSIPLENLVESFILNQDNNGSQSQTSKSSDRACLSNLFNMTEKIMKFVGYTPIKISPHQIVLDHDQECMLTAPRYHQPEFMYIKDLFNLKIKGELMHVEHLIIAKVDYDLGGIILQDSSASIRAITESSSTLGLESRGSIYVISKFIVMESMIGDQIERYISFNIANSAVVSDIEDIKTNQKPICYFIPSCIPLPILEFNNLGESQYTINATGNVLLVENRQIKQSLIKFNSKDISTARLLRKGVVHGLKVPIPRIMMVDDIVAISWNQRCSVLSNDPELENDLKKFQNEHQKVCNFMTVDQAFKQGLAPNSSTLINLSGRIRAIFPAERNPITQYHSEYLERVGAHPTSFRIMLGTGQSEQYSLEILFSAQISFYGLIVDRYISFVNLLIQSDHNGKKMGICIPSTELYTQTEDFHSARLNEAKTQHQTYIYKLLNASNKNMNDYWVFCNIFQILMVKIHYYCNFCQIQVSEDTCIKCQTNSVTVEAFASMVAEDGTLEFTLFISGYPNVLKLILSNCTRIESELKKNNGELRYSAEQWLSENERALKNNHTLLFRKILEKESILRTVKIKVNSKACQPVALFNSQSPTTISNSDFLKVRSLRLLDGEVQPSVCPHGIKVYATEIDTIDLNADIMNLLTFLDE
jgi:hypothetical protein